MQSLMIGSRKRPRSADAQTIHPYRSSALGAAIFLLVAFGSVIAARAQQVTYAYDELGRLVAVVDPSGNAATYSYDAVGNLLSISRRAGTASGDVIFSFSPSNGPVGTSVTIYGDGFSATPSQDTVKFNGTAATVSSATTTTVVANVPAGATSGTISVTAPSGLTTSSSSFTVTAQ